jgi:hypothetical protein
MDMQDSQEVINFVRLCVLCAFVRSFVFQQPAPVIHASLEPFVAVVTRRLLQVRAGPGEDDLVLTDCVDRKGAP